MGRMVTWWRNMGGLMAACVLALLIVAPTVSVAACVCENAATIVSVETGATSVQAVQNDPQHHAAPCDATCCVGGHCHHGGAMLDPAVAGVPTPAPVGSEHATASVQALASRTLSGPDRPPRG
jgi:hypothetical protein